MNGLENVGISQVGEAAAIIYAIGMLIRQATNFVNNYRGSKGQAERRSHTCPLAELDPQEGIGEWFAYKKQFFKYMRELKKGE